MQVKEVLSPLQMSKMFTLDFSERATKEKSPSFEDRRFLTIVQEGIHQRDDGHKEMPLPLKNNNVELSNNKELALSRLMKLKQRLKSDTRYQKDYVDFMQENIKNGFAEKVPKEEVSDKNKHIWYIPHHGVYHKKKPGKMKVLSAALSHCARREASACTNSFQTNCSTLSLLKTGRPTRKTSALEAKTQK